MKNHFGLCLLFYMYILNASESTHNDLPTLITWTNRDPIELPSDVDCYIGTICTDIRELKYKRVIGSMVELINIETHESLQFKCAYPGQVKQMRTQYDHKEGVSTFILICRNRMLAERK